MNLELSSDEARLLKAQLDVRITEMDGELVRTEKHELQVDLDRDIARLRAIDERLGRLLGPSTG
ncbi:Hypothetical protein A7982_05078 [Minicystis rosea]|nr:Hypothetical protein A7982_05078 [Minicystis rosea]